MINITESALKELQILIGRINDPAVLLRLNVKNTGGGCGGSPIFSVEKALKSKFDKAICVEGVKFVVNKKAYCGVKDLTIDFSRDVLSSGFKFINNNSSCKCRR